MKIFLQKVRTFLFKGWLVEALFLTLLTLMVTLSITYVSDYFYKASFGKQTFSKGKLTLVDTNGSNSQANTNSTQNNSGSTSTTNTSPSTSQTTQTTTSGATQTPPPSTPPPTTPPPTPPPAPSGCFVTVNGYLYNMQSAIGVVLTDPNTSKTRNHTSGNFHCGSFSAPTNMTSTYLSKHSGLGCAQRLAPYIYTPPAPTDPTC